ncbi:MAG TPA: hypothetical protein VLW26_00305 [Steroidobacteraceae bacterium]|nr:hypothetical protein [Steroidobacteraceae bacterium]
MIIAAGLALASARAASAASDVHEVRAGAPTDLAVTVYRAPSRSSDSFDLRDLEGFALVRETRTLQLVAGLNRVHFEGVADGIEPVSAIVSGLEDGALEKNLDAELLSPRTLIDAAAGKTVTLVRVQRKTGKRVRLSGTIVTGPGADGVLFKSDEGVEALRCTGLAEHFEFTGTDGLTPTPTLSLLVRAKRPVSARVTLSYLAHGFDWGADYTATLSADGHTLDLGAWVTLANANGVGFPSASTQVVAGRLNRASGEVEPIDYGGPVLARCWPRGTTSDVVALVQLNRAVPADFAARSKGMAYNAPAALMEEVSVTGSRVSQEQLGDLKLYRVPERTTVASRQSKQVRLFDRLAIPVEKIYGARLDQNDFDADSKYMPARVLLRTRNEQSNHLGLPLPSGRVAVFVRRADARVLLAQSPLRDLAVHEEVEIPLGTASDVQVRAIDEERTVDSAHAKRLPLVPGVVGIRQVTLSEVLRVEVANARATAIDFELVVPFDDDTRIVRADHALQLKDGHPMFRFRVPANGTAAVRFQVADIETRPTPER